jgi:hypothetical protein
MGPYAGVDYNLTLCPLQSRLLQHMYHGHWGNPYAIVDLNPRPESTLSLSQGLRNLASGLHFSVHILEEKNPRLLCLFLFSGA